MTMTNAQSMTMADVIAAKGIDHRIQQKLVAQTVVWPTISAGVVQRSHCEGWLYQNNVQNSRSI